MKFSNNKKTDAALTEIFMQLKRFEERNEGVILRYMCEPSFNREPDFNLASHGRLTVSNFYVREIYRKAGYNTGNYSTAEIWEMYRRQIGYILRNYSNEIINRK